MVSLAELQEDNVVCHGVYIPRDTGPIVEEWEIKIIHSTFLYRLWGIHSMSGAT